MPNTFACAAWTLLGLLLASAVTATEPPAAKPPAVVPAPDPLLAEIEQLRAEMQQLRQEVRGIGGPASPRPLPGATVGSPAESYDLWSFQPLAAPHIPAVADKNWPHNEIDRFILARLEKAGIQPNPAADPGTLIRRIAFDLTGLPPTRTELETFRQSAVRNPQSALETLVDGYLASPRFGERWGRHWLDVVRYADSVGRTWNAPFNYAWRYRDYVISAFNQDKPLDRFITEQLAGDLLPANSIDERRANFMATGFLALGSLALNDGRLEGFHMDRVDDQIDVTTRAFLGLTVSCARCHDHKYDPVTMRDYYALAGIFYSTQTLSGQGHQRDMGAGGYVDAQRLVRLPGHDGAVREELVPGVHSMSDFREAWSRVRDEVRYTTDPDRAMGAIEGEIRDCEICLKGDAYDRGEAPPRGDVHIPGLPGFPTIPSEASGRLELARWIVAQENPLTARVMANRVWRHLFGRGLASTVDNFGVNGIAPTHPELLDHLAVQLREGGWSMKRLIRTIVLSRTYRTSSVGQARARNIDPQNELYWRRDMRRLEVEALRDSLLQISGRLEPTPPFGIQLFGMGGKGKAGAVRSLLSTDAPYRTVYLPVIRALVPALYTTFDFPDPCQISGQREVTTVAPQALFFMNGEFVSRCAADAAANLLDDRMASNEDRARRIYQRLFARSPTSEELAEALEFLGSLEPPVNQRDPEHYRWTTFIQGLLATGEFRYAL